MTLLYLILLVAAFVLILLGAFRVASRRVDFVGLGLALWVLVALLQAFNKV